MARSKAKNKKASPKKKQTTVRKSAPLVKSNTTSLKEALMASSSPRTATQPVMSESQAMSMSQLVVMYGLFLLSNMGVLWAAHLLMPQAIVLGTMNITPVAASFYSMVVLTSVLVGILPLIDAAVAATKMKISNVQWILGYWVINAVALWGIARLAEQLGLGIAGWMVVLGLSFVMNMVQGLLVTQVVSKLKL